MMPNLPISQLPSVGNTGYTESDILVFVNYQIETGTTSNTPLSQVKEWVLSGLSENYLPLSGGTISGDTIFQSGLTANTISATTYLNLPGRYEKIVLRKVELGTREISFGLGTVLSNILDKREILDILQNASNYGISKVDYYFTINDPNDFERKKILWVTQTINVDYDSESAFDDIIQYVVDNYPGLSTVNFYVEVFLLLDNEYSAPTQIKLVNPLFNSLNPNKYSWTGNYKGGNEFIRNELNGLGSPDNWNTYTLYSNFERPFTISYYSADTSQDIPKKIYDIVNDPLFYNELSGDAKTVINVNSWDEEVKEVVKRSVYIEKLKNFYSKYKIPVNVNGFRFVNGFKYNNFYGDLIYDIDGSNPLIYSANANTNIYSSSTVGQFIDTYRIYPKGNFGYIYFSADSENNTTLTGLTYSVSSENNFKYLTTRANNTRVEYGGHIQVIPGINDTYSLKLDFSGSPTYLESQAFFEDILDNYTIINDYSVNRNNAFWTSMVGSARNNLFSLTSQGKEVVVTATTTDIIVGGRISHYNQTNVNDANVVSTAGTQNISYNFGGGFNVGGSGLDGYANSIAVQTDGKILVGGLFSEYLDYFNTTLKNNVVRLNSDGTLDTTFLSGNGYGFNDQVRCLVIQSDGKIICGGTFISFTDANGTYTCNSIARLNSDGTFDSTFNNGGTGFDNEVFSLALQSDGKIVVGGAFSEYVESGSSYFLNFIMRLNSDGTFDSSFLGDGTGAFNGTVLTIAVQSDGKILCGGSFTIFQDSGGTYDCGYIARLNSDGTFDTTFEFGGGVGFNNLVRSIRIQSDGKILCGGDFDYYSDNFTDTSLQYIIRLNSVGTIDFTFLSGGVGFNNIVNSIDIQSDGKILCGGNFTSFEDNTGPYNVGYIARLTSVGTFDSTFKSNNTGANGSVNNVRALPNGKVLIGGSFDAYEDDIQNFATGRVTRLTHQGYYDGGNGFISQNSDIRTIQVLPNGKMIFGGSLTWFRDDNSTYQIAGNITKLNSDGTLDTTFNIDGFGFNSRVETIEVMPDGKILCGGQFTVYENPFIIHSCLRIARLNSNGSFDSTFNDGGTGFNGIIYSLELQPDGKILCGGSYTQYVGSGGTYSRNNILRLNSDGTFDATFNNGGSGASSTVYDIKVQSDGKILCGGSFQTFTDSGGTYSKIGILRLNSDGTFDNTFNSSGLGISGLPRDVLVIEIQSDGKILVGGDFFQYNEGITTYSKYDLMRLNSDGTFDTTFNNGGLGFNNNDEILSLLTLPNGKILVGGLFSQYSDDTGTYQMSGLLRLNSDGSFDTTYNTLGQGYIDIYGKNDDAFVFAITQKINSFTGLVTPDIYLLLQSNDEKMLELSQNPVYTFTSITDTVYVGGNFNQYQDSYTGGNIMNFNARLNSNGIFDTSYNNGGYGFDDGLWVSVVKTLDNGKILYGGAFNQYVDMNGTYNMSHIARINNDGTFDTTFNDGGIGFNDILKTIYVQEDGKILCGGFFTNYSDILGTYYVNYIMRLNSDGTFDPTFIGDSIGGFDDTVNSIVVQQNGKILCGGFFTQFTDINNTYSCNRIARLNSDGTFDTSFQYGLSIGFDSTVEVIKLQPNGMILVGGNFSEYTDVNNTYSKQHLCRLNSNGIFDTTFNDGGIGFNGDVYTIELTSNGKILVGGSFTQYSESDNTFNLASISKLNENGTFDTSFINGGGFGFDDAVFSIKNLSDGKILVGGQFSSYYDNLGSYFSERFIRLNSDGTFSSSSIIGFDASVQSIDIFSELTTNTISVDAIYKGHSFRPLIYPLNLSQLLLEVPASYFYDGSALQENKNFSNNSFEYVGTDITNKKLCMIVKYKKINKYDVIQQNLEYTVRRGTSNNVFTMLIQNIENSITAGISINKRKYLRPGGVEVYFGFIDTNTNTLSKIPNYKLIIVKYGDNEIFKIVKDPVDIISGTHNQV
jgi:uncharacterized delta-60 repeat protein